MTTERLKHASKAYSYIYSRQSGKTTWRSFSQHENAPAPIAVVVFGIFTSSSLAQPENKPMGIVASPSGRTAVFSAAQFLNASFCQTATVCCQSERLLPALFFCRYNRKPCVKSVVLRLYNTTFQSRAFARLRLCSIPKIYSRSVTEVELGTLFSWKRLIFDRKRIK